ncbi:hypothetical protein C9439_00400 [archaeon SCG-AAA382B04]|nr:hypothetical protein C9439_00400 [archaeon SCG-AAA382B04]
MEKRNFLKTGIPRLDEKIGGIPLGASILYDADPEIEVDVFTMQSSFTNLWRQRETFFLTLSKKPESLREKFRDYGWDIDKFEESFHIIDGYSNLVGNNSSAEYVIEKPENIHSIGKKVVEALKDYKEPVFVLDSLSDMMGVCDERSCLSFLKNWMSRFKSNNVTSIFGFTEWSDNIEALNRVRGLFDGVIRISGVSQKILFKKYFIIKRASWVEDFDKENIFFEVFKPGGIKIYIPKVLVTGPFNSGKSSFIKSLSNNSIAVDRLGTTISLDHGRVKKNHLFADVFGTPGQRRFDPILKKLGKKAMGVFLVVDSTRPEQFVRAEKMLEKIKKVNLPYIVVANKQDMDGALSAEEIRESMELDEDVPVAPTIAISEKGVQKTFDRLIEMIMEEDVISYGN